MKGKWIQLVAVRLGESDAYLFRAPKGRCKPGDEVNVMTRHGQDRGKVLITKDTNEREEVDTIVTVFKAKWPLAPIVSKLTNQELVFGSEDWREEDDIQ